MKLILIFLTLVLAAPTWAMELTVAYVIDGDTFAATSGERVRLLDINTPEIAHAPKKADPFGEESAAFTKQLLPSGSKVKLTFGERKQDKYKRLLAHVYKADGTWVNQQIVQAGLGHVYSFPDNRVKTKELLAVEAPARAAHKGIWANPRWQILSAASSPFADNTVGKFYLVSGTVKNTAKVKGRIYLNFGEDWRNDFTVEIPQKYLPLFTKQNINPENYYMGKKLLVRGVIKPVNGSLVTASHPEQLEIME